MHNARVIARFVLFVGVVFHSCNTKNSQFCYLDVETLLISVGFNAELTAM